MKLRKFSFTLAAAVAAVAFVTSVTSARADFIEGPVKWSQPIQVDPSSGLILGMDHLSDHLAQRVMADDFISDGRPIVAVRWWGSYIGSTVRRPDGFVLPFDISFHFSNANLDPDVHPFSLPLSLIVLHTVEAQEVFVGFDVAGDLVYRYDAYLPQPFLEEAGVEYFLDIDKPTLENWGWHDTPLHFLDWAAVAPGHLGPWGTFTPLTDLAFELITIPEPGTVVLLGLGAGMLVITLRRRAQS